jgi:hypothetical protein
MMMGRVLDRFAWTTATPRKVAITIAVPVVGWIEFGIGRQFVTDVAGCVMAIAHGN